MLRKTDYLFKTEPFEHQREGFFFTRVQECFGFFWEQGTGKSKVIIDTAAYLYQQGKISALIVIAPNGVHRNWILNEVPAHMPDIEYQTAWWASNPRKVERERMEELLKPSPHLKIFTINFEGCSAKGTRNTTKAKSLKYIYQLLCQNETLLVIDESSKIKNPKALRTKAILNMRKYAKYRRILTGTPISQGPLDAYTQMAFLDPEILGFGSWYAFRNHFAILETEYNWKTAKEYTKVVEYKNLEELSRLLKPYTSRKLKIDCLDLPPKVYERRYVTMSPEQRKIYKEVRDATLDELLDLEYEIEDKVIRINAPIVLTKIMRLQQILGGFFPPDEENPKPTPLPGTNTRLNTLLEVLEETQGKALIWSRFVPEIRLIAKTIRSVYGNESTVLYYGEVSNDERDEAIRSFQDRNSSVRFFVGQITTGGYGLTLTRGATAVYYSNVWSLEVRLQSEGRIDRIGQENPMTYIDLETEDTVDKMIIDALREKRKLSDVILKDPSLSWL